MKKTFFNQIAIKLSFIRLGLVNFFFILLLGSKNSKTAHSKIPGIKLKLLRVYIGTTSSNTLL